MQVTKALVPVVVLSACGGSDLPQARVVDTEAEIVAAETVGADDHPEAALHLKLAKDQLRNAKKLAQDGDDEHAQLTLSRALVDAQLAISLAREARAREEAQRVAREVMNETSSGTLAPQTSGTTPQTSGTTPQTSGTTPQTSGTTPQTSGTTAPRASEAASEPPTKVTP